MQEKPIEAGCLAEVIDGLLGTNSPNIGLIVKVVKYVGDEKTLGRIWRCEAEYAQALKLHSAPTPPGFVDFAQSWLRRLPDDPAPSQKTHKPEGITA